MQEFKVHEIAKIRTGKYAGLVGEVTEIRPGGVRVKIEGVTEGKTMKSHAWYKISQVGRNHGE